MRALPINFIGTQRASGSPLFPPRHSLSARQGWQLLTVPTAVVAHWLVAGLHDLPPHTDSFATVHWTQVPALQRPFPTMSEHSSSVVQATHAPALHAEAVELEQSACFKHATHCFAVLSQNGFVLSLQSGLSVHCTQAFVVTSQAGFTVEHVDLSMHSTHLLVAVLHADLATLQVDVSTHSTQVFLMISQAGVTPVHPPSHGVAPALPASPAPAVPKEPEVLEPARAPAPDVPPSLDPPPLPEPPLESPATRPLLSPA